MSFFECLVGSTWRHTYRMARRDGFRRGCAARWAWQDARTVLRGRRGGGR